MRGFTQNYFAGGNTSKGFYSYFQYILDQKDAEYLVCIKGGPGTGKSTFMKNIAEHFLNKGEDVDMFWCSSDPDSLDAILLKKRQIAFMDATYPHMMDPLNPGAVDTIIHLGDFWDKEEIKKNKSYIIQSNRIIKRWFASAYNGLSSAAATKKILVELYSDALLSGELLKAVSELNEKVFSNKPVVISYGKTKKSFATAITSKGYISYINSMIKKYKKLYFFTVPNGFETGNIIKSISENAVRRGFSVEEFYCPMSPEHGPEHLLIPELDTGFITLNDYHDVEIWECGASIETIEIRDFMDWNYLDKFSKLIHECEESIESLMKQAMNCLKMAKQEHDILEEYYIQNMNFGKIEKLTDEWICKIEHNEV